MRPLAEQMRPKTFESVVGQDHLVGEEGLLRKVIKAGQPISVLLWGPPGCGKTTIARLFAGAFATDFLAISPMTTGITELKKMFAERFRSPLLNRQTILFVDEIHRFNKSQQDFFLPYIENGSIILIGATTENPSFALNSALLSRLRVLTLNPLSDDSLSQIVTTSEISFDQDAKNHLINTSSGDARHLCNMLESIKMMHKGSVSLDTLTEIIQKKLPNYDKDGDGHYNLISALHKTIRGSDPDAALYYLCRMLQGGEDPLFIIRRLIRTANEDIGLADPNAATLAITTWETFARLGSPEGELAIAQLTVYLALAPKSNAIYTAYKKATKAAAETSHLSPPMTILNSPTTLMKNLGYGKDYVYDHDTDAGISGQDYFPEEMGRTSFYSPKERGFEREMKKRIDYFSKFRTKNSTRPVE
jgi:putative ATPase